MNLASLIVLLLLLAAVFWAIRSIFRHRGQNSCGGNCSACGCCRNAENGKESDEK